MSAVCCPLRFSIPPDPSHLPSSLYFLYVYMYMAILMFASTLSINLPPNRIFSSICETPLSPPPPSFSHHHFPSPYSHSFIFLLLLDCCVCVCVVVQKSAEWMEPSCRSCQSLCQEMRSGCSEDTQHLSGTLQIRAPQAEVRACVCECVYAGMYLSISMWVHEEAMRLKVFVVGERHWWVCACMCLVPEL